MFDFLRNVYDLLKDILDVIDDAVQSSHPVIICMHVYLILWAIRGM